MYEQAIDRLACALGGKSVLIPAFHHIPGMVNSHDWRARHAGLMAIAAIAEGTSKVMTNELANIVGYVTSVSFTPSFGFIACLSLQYDRTGVLRSAPAGPVRGVSVRVSCHPFLQARAAFIALHSTGDNARSSGQLCTDLEVRAFGGIDYHDWTVGFLTWSASQEVIQEQFHQQLFNGLIPTLEAPEPRYASPSPSHLSLLVL